MRDQTQSTTCRWHGDVMRRASTRTYLRQEGKGQDRSCSSVRFVYLVSGHCSPCFCSMSRLAHNSRKPGTKNTVASTAPAQMQRGESGWFLDATFYFSLTPGSSYRTSFIAHCPTAVTAFLLCLQPAPAYTCTSTLYFHLYQAHCCRWPVPVGLLTHLNIPSASISASFISIVWSTRVRVAGLRGSPTSMQVVGPELWIGKARTRSAGASRRKEERKRTVLLHT